MTMSAVYRDDKWKCACNDDESPSRADLQVRIDRQYAAGELNVEEWRRGTEHLSACDYRGRVVIAIIGRRG